MWQDIETVIMGVGGNNTVNTVMQNMTETEQVDDPTDQQLRSNLPIKYEPDISFTEPPNTYISPSSTKESLGGFYHVNAVSSEVAKKEKDY